MDYWWSKLVIAGVINQTAADKSLCERRQIASALAGGWVMKATFYDANFDEP